MLEEIGLSAAPDYEKASANGFVAGGSTSDISSLLKEIYQVHLRVLSDCKGLRKQCTKLEKAKSLLLKRNRELEKANSELLEAQKALNEEMKANKVNIRGSTSVASEFTLTRDVPVLNATTAGSGSSKAVHHCASKSVGTVETAPSVGLYVLNTQPMLNAGDRVPFSDVFVPETVPLDFPAVDDDSKGQNQYVVVDESAPNGLQSNVKHSIRLDPMQSDEVVKSPVFNCPGHSALQVPVSVSSSPSLFDDEEEKRSLQRSVDNTVALKPVTVQKHCPEVFQLSCSLLRRNECLSTSVLTENDEVKENMVADQPTMSLQNGCKDRISIHQLSESTAGHDDNYNFSVTMKQDVTGNYSAADVADDSSGSHEPLTKKKRDETTTSNSNPLHCGAVETLSSAKNADKCVSRSINHSHINMNDSFDRVANGDVINYRYTEVVRKQNLRRQMDGFACFQCQQWFHGLGLSEKEIAERLKHCRHKAQFEPAATPAHYWSVSFLTTQQCKEQDAVTDKVEKPLKCRRKKGLRQLFDGGKGDKNLSE